MPTINIPKQLLREKELVILPKRDYERFLDLEKIAKKRLAEIADTDLAIKIYKREKRQGKLKTIKSLAGLS